VTAHGAAAERVNILTRLELDGTMYDSARALTPEVVESVISMQRDINRCPESLPSLI
jgi:hypothetical protein